MLDPVITARNALVMLVHKIVNCLSSAQVTLRARPFYLSLLLIVFIQTSLA